MDYPNSNFRVTYYDALLSEKNHSNYVQFKLFVEMIYFCAIFFVHFWNTGLQLESKMILKSTKLAWDSRLPRDNRYFIFRRMF